MVGKVLGAQGSPLDLTIADDRLQVAVDRFMTNYLERNPIRDGRDGVDGKDGATGRPGRDGAAGKDGKDGLPGKDGEPGRNGEPGRDGKDGVPGKDGQAGRDGRDGLDGKPGAPGKPGTDGRDGIDGKDGEPGAAGKDGLRGEPGQGFRLVGSGTLSQTGIAWSGLRRVDLALKGIESAHSYIVVASSVAPEGYAIGDAIAVTDGRLSVAVTGPDLREDESYAIPVRVYRIG